MCIKTQAIQPGRSQNNRVEPFAVQLLQARGHVAPQIKELQVGTTGPQLHLAPRARRADLGTLGQVHETHTRGTDEGIGGVFPFRYGTEGQATGQFRGKILQAVHREIDGAIQQRHLQLFGEDPFATDLGQGHIGHPVTLGGNNFHGHFEIGREGPQSISNMIRLCQGQIAAPRSNYNPGHPALSSRPKSRFTR